MNILPSISPHFRHLTAEELTICHELMSNAAKILIIFCNIKYFTYFCTKNLRKR